VDIAVGDIAPDFTLRNQDGHEVSLADFRGVRAVVVIFYPFAFSGICGGELCSIRDQVRDFSNDDVATLAVSTDAPPALKAWATAQGFTFDLLADFWPHGAVARRYGVFNDQVGVAERGTVIVDRDGRVVHTVHNAIGDARDDQAYLDALSAIGAA
jgi:peroxiredoxin